MSSSLSQPSELSCWTCCVLYGDRRYQKHDNCSEESIKGNYECNWWIGINGLSLYFDYWVMGLLIFGKPVVFGWETDLMLICNCEGNPNHTFFSLFIFFLFVTRCAGWGWKETRELGRELVGAQAEARLVTQWTPFNIFLLLPWFQCLCFWANAFFQFQFSVLVSHTKIIYSERWCLCFLFLLHYTGPILTTSTQQTCLPEKEPPKSKERRRVCIGD